MRADRYLTQHLKKLSQLCSGLIEEMLDGEKYRTQAHVPSFDKGRLVKIIQQQDSLNFRKMRYDIERDKRWTGSPSFKIAKNILKNRAEELRGGGSHYDDDDVFATKQIALFVTQLALRGGHKDHDAFRATLSKFYRHLSNCLKHATYVTPLYNTGGDFSEIKLSPNLRIRRVTDAEYSKIVRLDTAMENVPIYKRRLRFVLVCREAGPPSKQLQQEATSKYVLALNALRLFKDGDPQFGRVYGIESEHMDVGTIETLQSHYENPVAFKEVGLSGTDVRKFESFHSMMAKRLEDPKRSGFLHNVISRFGMAHMHRMHANRIVDYVIALEALLTDSPGESTLKLAHRTAAICADTDSDRVNTWEFIKRAYNFRSGIVHKSEERKITVRSSVMEVKDVDSRLHGITKKSILRMVALLGTYKSQKDVLDALDRSMYDRKELARLQKTWSS